MAGELGSEFLSKVKPDTVLLIRKCAVGGKWEYANGIDRDESYDYKLRYMTKNEAIDFLDRQENNRKILDIYKEYLWIEEDI